MTLILASTSARRKQLLSWLIDDFKIIPADINEDGFVKLARTPEELVVNLAKAKARKVWEKIHSKTDRDPIASPRDERIIILAADTVVILPHKEGGYEVIGKPKDAKEAKEIFSKLRGTTHLVYTGMCVMFSKEQQSLFPMSMTDYTVSKVTFGTFSDSVLEKYIASGSPYDKAGGYGIQELDKEFGVTFEGSFTNIVGLPIQSVVEILKKLGVTLKPGWQEKVKEETGQDN